MDVKPLGPGPNYPLPSTVGFEHHDPTRNRAPAFSLGSRKFDICKKLISPAANVYNPIKFTRFGLTTTQANSLGPKLPISNKTVSPGPNTYNPKYSDFKTAAPAYSILTRKDPKRDKSIPAPNIYKVPPCTGTTIPDKCNSSAFSILGRNFTLQNVKTQSPGPKYMLPDINVYKKSPPNSSLGVKLQRQKKSLQPGPNKYNPKYNQQKEPPNYSFGVKRYPFLKALYLPEDREN
uniref:Uncharacterized protein n=1 Tax=Clastoptera arizonana TaxID=38151 RepID=A0A1B6CX82_9HEMI